MKWRATRVTVVACVLIALLIPASIVSSQGLDREHSDQMADQPPRIAVETNGSSNHELGFANSIEYELPTAPPKRDRTFCEDVPRLCDWLTYHGKLVGSDSKVADANPVVAENDFEEAANGQSSDQGNRSIVGWKSASISTINQSSSPDPVALEVPSLSISAEISGVGIDDDRSMQVPDDYNTVGWYRYGPAPGNPGTAVIAGHLDDERGRSVFYDLQHVEVGSEVTVKFEDGSAQTFTVYDRRAYDSGNLPSEEIFSREGDSRLALITCGGRWDRSIGRYTETVVVYAEPA